MLIVAIIDYLKYIFRMSYFILTVFLWNFFSRIYKFDLLYLYLCKAINNRSTRFDVIAYDQNAILPAHISFATKIYHSKMYTKCTNVS